MARVFLAAVLLAVPISYGVLCASHTELSVTGTVIAVVSGAEIDVLVTRSSLEKTVAEGVIARVVYHGLLTPGRFDPLYMEAFDLNWNLVVDSEVYLDVADAPWDEERRLHAYVYLDPGGYGMLNAILLASGLAAVDPVLDPAEPHAAFLTEIAAAAERCKLGIWAETGE